MVTTVTGKNQITVPASIAKSAGILPGTRLDWQHQQGDLIYVRVLPSPARVAASLRGRGKQFMRQGVDPLEQLLQGREDEDRERIQP